MLYNIVLKLVWCLVCGYICAYCRINILLMLLWSFYEYEKDRFNDSLCFIRLLIGCCYVGTKKFYPHDLTSCCFCYMGRGALMEERYLTFQSPRMKNGFTPNIAWS